MTFKLLDHDDEVGVQLSHLNPSNKFGVWVSIKLSFFFYYWNLFIIFVGQKPFSLRKINDMVWKLWVVTIMIK